MNWLSDQIQRVLCTARQVVEEVKEDVITTEDLNQMWRKIRAALNRALDPHPEVRMTVLREFEVEFGTA